MTSWALASSSRSRHGGCARRSSAVWTDAPVIAVPTSVGCGTALGGATALLSMLNSCASGVSVVNIDNGFGAGYLAGQINNMEG